MLTTSNIKNQSLKYITEHLQYDNFTDKQVMDAHEWVSQVLLDFEKVYGPSETVEKQDVLRFLDIYLEATYSHIAQGPAEDFDPEYVEQNTLGR
tara:strand:- start:4 stop:285 length:282 start_codon:yes stop_codon:yes gene_type:complete